MRPNYKESAKKYFELWTHSETQRSTLLHGNILLSERVSRQANEISELKIKYSEALNKIIELQENLRGACDER